MFCSECGNQCRDGAKFCNKCGAPLDIPADANTPDANTADENSGNANMQEIMEKKPDTHEPAAGVARTDEDIKETGVESGGGNGKGIVIALSVVTAVLAFAVIFVCLFFFTDSFKKKGAEEPVAEAQQDNDAASESVSDSKDETDEQAADAKDEPEQKDKEPASESTSSDPDELLEKKISELSFVDLNGISYAHQLKGYAYECDGLGETVGAFKVYTWDLDFDGQYELLCFSLDYNERENTHFITMDVYEVEGNEVVKADSAIPVPYIFNGIYDSGDVQFFIKDDKYLCIVDESLCMLEADGASAEMNIYTYNGKNLELYAHADYAGSEWVNVGSGEKGFCDLCKKIGLEKTAYLLYNTDHFYFSTADAGLQPMFKLRAELSGADNDPALWTEISFIDDTPASDFIFDESAWRLLAEQELAGLTKDECRIARNEIYARNAWNFEDAELKAYFGEKAWYRPTCGPGNITDNDLNDIERSNIRLIKEAESGK